MGGIRLRAHHLLCIHGFRGQGYSPLFVANMARLVHRLENSPETSIQVVNGADDVCSACPHMDEGKCIRPDQRVDELDQRVRAQLGFDKGYSASWSSILDIIRDRIDPFRLEVVCDGCRWLDLDYCTNGLASLARVKAAEE
ncbi:MAG: DUF1284 domain-containing protein [Thermoleophilia bacterium]